MKTVYPPTNIVCGGYNKVEQKFKKSFEQVSSTSTNNIVCIDNTGTPKLLVSLHSVIMKLFRKYGFKPTEYKLTYNNVNLMHSYFLIHLLVTQNQAWNINKNYHGITIDASI